MLILYNANIYAPGQPPASALAVDKGRFVAIGKDEELLNGFPNADRNIDMRGNTIWPGLIDAHVHLLKLAQSMDVINCETDSPGECLAQVQNASRGLPPGAWIRGHGWNQNRWTSGFGTAEQLDAVCARHPAYLTAKSLHAAWVNSAALAMAGIDNETPDPPKGSIQRDQHGKPTGILFEMDAMSMVESIIPQPTPSELARQIEAVIPKLWELGVVGVHDFDSLDCWKVLQELHQRRKLKIRVRKNIPYNNLDVLLESGLRTDFGDDWLHLGSLKLFADGALGPRTAAMHQPYENSNERGLLLLKEADIVDIGQQAVSSGISLAVHAIGDRANHVVLNAFDRLRQFERTHGLLHLQHRIEHVQIIHQDDLPRFAQLDIIASVQPVHAPSDMYISDQQLGDRAKYAYTFRSLLANKAMLVFGSDAPVESVNPFLGIHAAVTRQRVDGTPGKNGWHADQRLSLSESVRGFSQMPALVAKRGSHLGRIIPGYKADFIILREDPFSIELNLLHTIKPLATFIEGECLYHSAEFSFD